MADLGASALAELQAAETSSPPASASATPSEGEGAAWQRAFEALVSKCGIPQTSRVDVQKQATEEELCELIDKCAPPSTKAEFEQDHLDVSNFTDKMRLLKKCINDGDVNLRSA
eukprot:7730643-Pyramimonas_sp.AAC.1